MEFRVLEEATAPRLGYTTFLSACIMAAFRLLPPTGHAED